MALILLLSHTLHPLQSRTLATGKRVSSYSKVQIWQQTQKNLPPCTRVLKEGSRKDGDSGPD